MTFVYDQKYVSKYGVVEQKGNNVKKILEKPTFHFKINSGIYLINSRILNLVPHNKFFTMVDFVNLCLKKRKKVIFETFIDNWRSIESPEDLGLDL